MIRILRNFAVVVVCALAIQAAQQPAEASHYSYSCPDMQAQCRLMGGEPYYNSECEAGDAGGNHFVWEVCVLPWSPSQAYFCCPSELCECDQPQYVSECQTGLCHPD